MCSTQTLVKIYNSYETLQFYWNITGTIVKWSWFTGLYILHFKRADLLNLSKDTIKKATLEKWKVDLIQFLLDFLSYSLVVEKMYIFKFTSSNQLKDWTFKSEIHKTLCLNLIRKKVIITKHTLTKYAGWACNIWFIMIFFKQLNPHCNYNV